MVKRITPKPKKNTSTKSVSLPKSAKRGTSTSQISQQSRSKSDQTPKKKTRKVSAWSMRIGGKTFKVSRKIMKEIRHYQKSTENLIPRLPFSRLIRELLLERAPAGGRVQRLALEALHTATEVYLVQFLEDSYSCALHARRSTLTIRDMHLITHLRGP